MKKFIVYLLVIVVAVSLGFAVFYLVRDNEVISISSASMYKDVGDTFTIDVNHENKKSYTEISISSSDESIVSYNSSSNNFTAKSGGVARINFRTTNTNFRNLWCDVIVGDGSVESPFYISTPEQLAAIGMGAEYLDENGKGLGVYAGAEPYTDYRSDSCYKLVANIDASKINDGYWVPLRRFSGRFDGNGLTISNINIDKESYVNHFQNSSTYNPNLFVSDNVGLFQEVTSTGVVYNLKLDNYSAKGIYDNFGTITAINQGTIERIEVKNAFLSVETKVFGGIVAINTTTEQGENTTYDRNIARIDRCSINMTLGQKYILDSDENLQLVVLGDTGVIGGLVGINNGGTIVYSYTKGNIYFGDDTTNTITYGGLIAQNNCITLSKVGGAYTTLTQGANIKDCYSNLNTVLYSAPNTNSIFAGAIAINQDYSDSYYESDQTKQIVNNFIIGVYYNKDNLNSAQDGITKDFSGIKTFKVNSTEISFVEQKTVVLGITTDNMKLYDSYVSHNTYEISYDEEGTSQNEIIVVEKMWLFDTVWAMDENNEGMPYLNYQLIYIPDDFKTAGVPILLSSSIYKFENTVDFPVSIVSGSDRKLTIQVGATYDLKVSPAGQSLTWTSSAEDIVSVDANGKITGLKVGSALITVRTKAGSTDTITIIVESDESYSITNYPQKAISIEVGSSYAITGVVVTPATTLTYITEDNTIATVTSTGVVTALKAGTTKLLIIAGNTQVSVTINCIAKATSSTDKKVISITTSERIISKTYTGTAITGTVSVSSATYNGVSVIGEVTFNYSSSNSNVVLVDSNGNYTIVGVGDAVIYVEVDTTQYIGIANVYVSVVQGSTGSTTLETISLNYSSYTLKVGESVQLYATSTKTIYWTSSNTNVTVNNGLVSANAYTSSQVVITAYIIRDDGTYAFAYCYITVKQDVPTTVTINQSATSVEVGDTVVFTATTNLGGGVTWYYSTSSNWTIVSQSSTQLTVKMNAVATLTVTAMSGTASASATVTSTDPNAYDPYITTAKQLYNMRNHLDKTFYLSANIDLSEYSNWEPIGTASNPFKGKLLQRYSGTVYTISGLNTSGSTYAGLFGYVVGAGISTIKVINSSISGTYAGAIAGRSVGSVLEKCQVSNTTVSASKSAGAIIGESSSTSIYTPTVMTGSGSVYITSGNSGNAGGVVGYQISGTIVNALVSSSTISANMTNSNFAGGIVGKTTGNISACTVKTSSIKGYYVGGIGGDVNVSNSVSLKFNEYKKGFRKEDLSSSSYTSNITQVAVKETVTITGECVGGLFGTISSGVVLNSYTRAKLNGNSNSSEKAGFAVTIGIQGSTFTNDGGSGSAGIVDTCYSACSFDSKGDNYAVTSSLVHNYMGMSFGAYKYKTSGYIFNYVYDKTLSGKAEYSASSSGKDYINAGKTTSEMKQSSTYSTFGAAFIKGSDYPTLASER